MAKSRQSIRRTDRMLAAAIWVFSGFMAGLAVAVFIDVGIFVVIGLLLGVFIAWRQDLSTRRRHQAEDDA